eukprot:1151197-Pelagomonas_calceolata.AAC.2
MIIAGLPYIEPVLCSTLLHQPFVGIRCPEYFLAGRRQQAGMKRNSFVHQCCQALNLATTQHMRSVLQHGAGGSMYAL